MKRFSFFRSCKVILTFLTLLFMQGTIKAQEPQTLTVYDGTSLNYYIPAPIYMFNLYCRSQFIIPAADLDVMNAGTITAFKFYMNCVPTNPLPIVDVYLMEVDYTTMTALEPKGNATIVYNGTLNATGDSNSGEINIVFDTPFEYYGGNLLVGIENLEKVTYSNVKFYGTSVLEGPAWYGDNSQSLDNVVGKSYNFIPKTTITYSAPPSEYTAPTSVSVGEITHDEATVTWSGEGELWNLRYKTYNDAKYTVVEGLTAQSYHLDNLIENTKYIVGVQTESSNGLKSYFRSTTFITLNPCAAPTDLQISAVTASTATLSWSPGYQETSWVVKYKKSSQEDWVEQPVSGTPTVTLNGLEGHTNYTVRVFNCDNYAQDEFTTMYSYPYHEDFSCAGLPDGWTQYKNWLSEILGGQSLTLYTDPYYGGGWKNATLHDFNVEADVLDGNHLINKMGDTQWLRYMVVSPPVLIGKDAQLSFDFAYTDHYGTSAPQYVENNDDKFVVLISKDNMSTWTVLRQWDDSGSSFVLHTLSPSREFISIDLSEYEDNYVNLAFHVESRNVDWNTSVFHIDNFALEPNDEYEMPYALAVSNVTRTTADLTWSSKADKWDIDVNGTVIQNVTSKTYQLTDLTPETQYTIKVRANFGENKVSRWSNPAIITTAISCPTPSGLSYSGFTSHSVTLDWTENGTATQWEISLNGDEEHPVVANSNPFTIDNLTEDMKYTARVRAVNSQDDKSHQWSDAVTFWPTDKRVIGSGLETDKSVPTNTWYKNSLTEQIYTAAELGAAGAILSIDFYHLNVAKSRNLDIYIVSTDKSSFSGNKDWVSVTTDDLYFSGQVDFAADAWTTVVLDNPFIYDGQKNLIIVIDDNTGSFWGNDGTDFLVFNAPDQALYVHRDDINYNPVNPPTDSYDSRRQDLKNRIRLEVGSASALPRPLLLTANYTGNQVAELNWVSKGNYDFEINVNGDVLSWTVNTNTAQLTGLPYKTEYTVMVRAKSGDEVSEWSRPAVFTTPYCAPEDMCQITFELTDNSSIKDGWNGAAIKVTVADDGFDLGTVTLESGGFNTVSVPVPDGERIKLEWISGNYDYECSYVIKDHNGDVIFARDNAMNGPVFLDVDCSLIAMPSELTISDVTVNSAKLSWSSNQTGCVLQLMPWTQVGQDVAADGQLVTYSFDLSNYSGTGSVAIRHYDVIGHSRLLIDDIVLTDSKGNTIFSDDFEKGMNYSLPAAVTKIDLDGDGESWEYGKYGSDYFNGNSGYVSFSWIDYFGQRALSPDNWLIISGVELGGTLTLKARAFDAALRENFGIFVSPDIADEIQVGSTPYLIEDLNPDTPYSCRLKHVSGNAQSNWATTLFKTLDNLKVFSTEGNWNDDSNWLPTGIPDHNNKVRIDAAATIPAGVTAQAGKVILNTDASNVVGSITIEDGGQLKQGASSLRVTVKKSISAGTDNFISSPITGRAEILYNPYYERVENLTSGTYDCYAFDPTCQDEWRNGKVMGYSAGDSKSYLFKGGMLWGNGYYYSNNDDVTLTYIGLTNSSYQNETLEPYTYDAGSTDDFNGWKLVGNPYTCDGVISYSNSDAALFYKYNPSTNKYDIYQGSVVLAPGQAAFIQVTESGNIIYSTEVPQNPGSIVGTAALPLIPQRGEDVNQDAGVFLQLNETDGVSTLISNYPDATYVNASFTRSFVENTASTVCLPFPITGITGGTLYEFVGVDYDSNEGWVATMQQANLAASPTQPDQPLLFMPGSTGNVKFSGIIPAVASLSAGESVKGDWKFNGTYTEMIYGTSPFTGKVFGFAANNGTGTDSQNNEVAIKAGEFVRATTGAKVRPFRAYLTYTGTDNSLQAPSRSGDSTPDLPDRITVRLVSSNGTVTSVGTLNTNTGEVTIGAWYDMYGRKLDGKPTREGLYINNGRKVMIRQ